MIDLEDIRKRHYKYAWKAGEPEVCDPCGDDWPCDTVRLADEVERLRGEVG